MKFARGNMHRRASAEGNPPTPVPFRSGALTAPNIMRPGRRAVSSRTDQPRDVSHSVSQALALM